MEHIVKYYNVPAKINRRITFRGKLGKITGARNCGLIVRLDGESKSRLVHPTWEMTYEP